VPLAGHGLRPASLRRRASRPQLKRDPLGSAIMNVVVESSWAPIGLGLGLAILIGLALVIWALTFSKAAGGTGMERPYWGTQFYAYSVCIIAVIVFLFSLIGLLSSAFDAAQPLRARIRFGPILTSFEAYKATYDREPRMFGGTSTAPIPPSEDEVHRRYDALRQDRIEGARFDFLRSLVSDGLLLLLAIALFVVHWRLAGRAARLGASGAA